MNVLALTDAVRFRQFERARFTHFVHGGLTRARKRSVVRGGFGPEMHSTRDFYNQTSSGANLLTITAGHTLDLVEALLGEVVEVDARTETLWPAVRLTDLDEDSLRDAPDQVAVLGRTSSGAVFTADINAGVAPEDVRFSFEIWGSEGWLRLMNDHPYGFQAGNPTDLKSRF